MSHELERATPRNDADNPSPNAPSDHGTGMLADRAHELEIMLRYVLSGRCAVCGWTLAKSPNEGCVQGNCCYRPQDSPFQETWLKRAKMLNEIIGIASASVKPPAAAAASPPMANRRFAALLAIQNEWADTTPDDESHLKLAEQGEIQLAQAESLAQRVEYLTRRVEALESEMNPQDVANVDVSLLRLS
jgi:hypothetical protein